MSFWDSLAVAGIFGHSLLQATGHAKKEPIGMSDQEKIAYLEQKVKLLEAKLANQTPSNEEYVNPDYPAGGIRCQFRPEDISHDGLYVRTEKGWIPWASVYD